MNALAAVCPLTASTAAQHFISQLMLGLKFKCHCQPWVFQLVLPLLGFNPWREAGRPRCVPMQLLLVLQPPPAREEHSCLEKPGVSSSLEKPDIYLFIAVTQIFIYLLLLLSHLKKSTPWRKSCVSPGDFDSTKLPRAPWRFLLLFISVCAGDY